MDQGRARTSGGWRATYVRFPRSLVAGSPASAIFIGSVCVPRASLVLRFAACYVDALPRVVILSTGGRRRRECRARCPVPEPSASAKLPFTENEGKIVKSHNPLPLNDLQSKSRPRTRCQFPGPRLTEFYPTLAGQSRTNIMQRTQKQVDASRRNRSLSHGLTMLEGRLRSSLNSLTHRLDAATPESKEAFEDLHRLSRHHLRLPAALRAQQKNRGNEPNVSQPAHHQQDRDSACNGNPVLTHS